MKAQIAPRDLDGPLRAVILTRSTSLGPNAAQNQASEAEAWIRAVYDWPLQIENIELPGALTYGWLREHQISQLIERGEVDLVLVSDLSRISRRRDEALEILEKLVQAGIRVVCIEEGLDFAIATSA